ncbi:MAG: LysR family transcriptional regulator, glycine cleavage system transcriptional activator [Rhodobacteraceae bacterium HLUCCO07]|nr:MAG: LysR family transcriptional regulator, glycine cleavage system transcriptional activator [Rhodobacteraceae bacterium HLUCCO07]
MTPLPHVIWLRAFEAAARHSSFTAAADELALTPAAVSQQIRLLEQHLNVRLFHRLPRGVELTDIGQAYAQPIRKSFRDMQSATDGLFQVPRRKTLRVRASISYGALVLAPQLIAFRALNPDIDIQLSTAVWSDRMDDTAIDVDIRHGTGDWPESRIWPLGSEWGGVVCHPDFAASFEGGPTIAALAASDVVQVTGSEGDWDRLSARFDLDLPAPAQRFKADSSLMALQMLASGQGCAIIMRRFAQRYLDQGLLVSPLPYELPMDKGFYLVAREDTKRSAEIERFRAWLTATVEVGQ